MECHNDSFPPNSKFCKWLQFSISFLEESPAPNVDTLWHTPFGHVSFWTTRKRRFGGLEANKRGGSSQPKGVGLLTRRFWWKWSWTYGNSDLKLAPLYWYRGKVKVKALSPVRLLWPHGSNSPWSSPDQNTGVGSISILQGIFPTQGLNPGLPHCRRFFTSWATRDALREASPKVYRGWLWNGDRPRRSEFKILMRNPEMHWKVSGKLGGKPLGINKRCCSVAKSCPTVWTLLDCTPPGSSLLRDFQARILEWVAISFSRGSSTPGTESASPVSPALQACSLPLAIREAKYITFNKNKAFFLRTASKP